MNFDLSPEATATCQKVRDFIRTVVVPAEKHDREEDGPPDDVVADLRRQARAAGVWAPHLPRELGGLGLETIALCGVFEEAGYSPLGPLALHCAAPDEGNMHLLLKHATPAQRGRYLAPLAAGTVRSCFAMTEPAPGAGSGPTMLRTRADRRDGKWVINGRKWFTSGAMGAAFAIVAAVTDPQAPPRQGATLFLVEADTPGYAVVRAIPTMGSGGPGGHCEVTFTDCAVSDEQILGRPGEGFALMQRRLGPARLTHCMRWLGAAQRAMDVAVPYVRSRQAFGKPLAEHQAVQWPLADSLVERHASRLMVLEAAWRLERGEEARVQTSMCKVFVAEAVGRIIDRCVQVCGAAGIARDGILERLYRDVRAFRIYDGPSEVHRMVIARAAAPSPRGGTAAMNEADWLSGKDPMAMLDYLVGRASDRKFRLFACACARRYWGLLRYPTPRNAIALAERYAEGLADVGEVEQMRQSAEASAMNAPEFEAQAYQAAADTLADSAVEAAQNAREHAREQAVAEAAIEMIPGENLTRVRNEASAAECRAQCDLIREVFGNPFRPPVVEAHWLAGANGAPGAIARLFHEEARFEELPYLADALEDAGCTDDVMLDHLREPHGHARGCWALDALLGLQ